MDALETALQSATSLAPSDCRLRDDRRQGLYLDARRAMEICNACRYCEGFCAVFPAVTLRREFHDADLDYLANLCHNCRGCFFSCQYAPPHEFGVNVPKLFAELRTASYEKYAWPRPLGRLFQHNGTIVSLAMVLVISIVFLLTMVLVRHSDLYASNTKAGSFYAVIPWSVMVAVAGVSLSFSVLALTISGINFWRGTGTSTGAGTGTGPGSILQPRPLADAVHDVLTLRNLGGGGNGCNDLNERYSSIRRRFHHAMFYGFMLCFASTILATIYDHFLGRIAPYAFLSIPVQLGFWGGVGLLIGAAGFAWLKVAADPGPAAPSVMGADFALLMLLTLTSLTGMLLLGLRATPAMGTLLSIHLGVVLTLFVLMPYSKMVHGLYRSLALLRSAIERKTFPNPPD